MTTRGHRAFGRVRRMLSLLQPATVAAGMWALLRLHEVRTDLTTRQLRAVWVAPPPRRLPMRARRGAAVALRLARATCLQRSLILQSWDRAHGRTRAIVIGVTAPSAGFRAHAWLEGEHGCDGSDFHELLRVDA